MKHRIVLALAAGLLGACASQPPDWVINPKVDGGFAATECLPDSGNLSLDRQIVVAKARAEIAKQVELRVAAMDKTYTRLTEQQSTSGGEAAPKARALETAFESVSKQVAEQTLSGLSPERVEYIEYRDQRQLCAMIAVQRPKTREIFDRAVQSAGVTAAAPVQEALYQQFAAPPAGQ